jgi:hypothetical protein
MSQIIEKLESAKDTAREFDLNNSCHNLYQICLQYFSTLTKLKHSQIHLITVVLDALISLKKNMENQTYEENVKTYDQIHGLAYKNIQLIYDYDKDNKVEEVKESDDEMSGRINDDTTPISLF